MTRRVHGEEALRVVVSGPVSKIKEHANCLVEIIKEHWGQRGGSKYKRLIKHHPEEGGLGTAHGGRRQPKRVRAWKWHPGGGESCSMPL